LMLITLILCTSFLVLMLFLIFFFQAEDGIRDFHVTGVQTCALPISSSRERSCTSRAIRNRYLPRSLPLMRDQVLSYARRAAATRSEERRVGKARRLQRPSYR